MSEAVAVLRHWRAADGQGDRLYLWCPGCNDLHAVCVHRTNDGVCWQWDGNLEAPTISPSIKVEGKQWPEDAGFYKPNHSAVPAGGPTVCHSFVKNGQWEFLGDCTHNLKGQIVPLPSVPNLWDNEEDEG